MTRQSQVSWQLVTVVVVAIVGFCGSAGAAEVAEKDDPGLRQRIRALRDGVRDVPLPLIIEELSGHAVHPWTGQCRAQLTAVAEAVLTAVNRDGLTAGRVNEAGNAIEPLVFSALVAHGFRAGRPAVASGRMQTAGYPDLEAFGDDGATPFYIEVKTYSAGTEDSTQRSFYLSPSTEFKVTRAAIHLLIAIQLESLADDRYRATHVRWLDLSALRCDLKHEFNASNRDLYRPGSGLVIIEEHTTE